MDTNLSRVLIKTIIQNTLKEIRQSPKRGLRKLVDLALHVSSSRFQQSFFEIAQRMLKNEDSPYYALVRDVACNVDFDKTVTFGMNLGYESCTLGAKRIREVEMNERFNIPWCVSVHLTENTFARHRAMYEKLLEEGKELGIFTWLLIADDCPCEILSLIACHHDCAFFLFLHPGNINSALIEKTKILNNVMIVVSADEEAEAECALLKQKGLLYSVYGSYDDVSAKDVLSGAWLNCAVKLGGVFSGLIAKKGTQVHTQAAVSAYMKQMRDEQTFKTLPIEIVRDICCVDGIISEEECWASFDLSGSLCTPERKGTLLNLVDNSLADIFRSAFPRQKA